MTDKIEPLLCDYWDAAYQEGKEGRTNDTEDAKAQLALSAIRAEFRVLRQRVAEQNAELEKWRDFGRAISAASSNFTVQVPEETK